MPDKFNEYKVLLRETAQGGFTIVSYDRVVLPAVTQLAVPMKRVPLKGREVLIRASSVDDWVSTEKRAPTQDDADISGNVLTFINGESRPMPWNANGFVLDSPLPWIPIRWWKKLPAPPRQWANSLLERAKKS